MFVSKNIDISASHKKSALSRDVNFHGTTRESGTITVLLRMTLGVGCGVPQKMIMAIIERLVAR